MTFTAKTQVNHGTYYKFPITSFQERNNYVRSFKLCQRIIYSDKRLHGPNKFKNFPLVYMPKKKLREEINIFVPQQN
jgi:hypothetical protein